MSKIKKLINLVISKKARFDFIVNRGGYRSMPDEVFLKRKFELTMGYPLDLENPQTLNEKLQWLKLYDRRPEYTTMVDKYAAKKWVADRIGEQYIIPTLGVWEHFDEIDFDKLPEQFVLKCTHDSGGLVIVKDKSSLNKQAAKKKIEKCLKRNYYYAGREWPYKNVPPRIIAEPYLFQNNEQRAVDYKIYTYGGKTIYFMYSKGEAEHNVRNHKFDVNMVSIDHLFKKVPAINVTDIVLPTNMPDMLVLAEILAKGTQHLRVDMYNVDGKIYIGELTFYSGSGYINIESKEYARYLASLIDLSAVTEGIDHENQLCCN